MQTRKHLAIFALWVIAVAVYFALKAPISMRADWTHDDLMNCYRALETPWPKVFGAIVFFWQPTNLFRPLGELFYKIAFDYSGFNMWPWRLAISAILVLNAFILGHVAARLSGSFAFGLASAAIAAFHTLWSHLYLNTGTIFEILAFTFVYLGLAAYVEFHDKPWGLYLTAAIYILGINSKESAIVLPVYLALYELLWHKRFPWKLYTLFGAISLAFIFGRVLGPKGISTIGMYKPEYSLSMYLARFRDYFGPLILWKQAPLWAALLIAFSPLLLRKRMAVFAALVFPIGILPLAFVPDRGLEGVYIACAGLALSVPCLLLYLPTEKLQLAAATALFFAFGIWMPAQTSLEGIDGEYREIRSFHEQMKALAPTLPKAAQIRFVNEPFPDEMTWASIFAARLVYRDPSLDAIGSRHPNRDLYPRERDVAVFDWHDGKMTRLK